MSTGFTVAVVPNDLFGPWASTPGLITQALSYWTDAWQRTWLFWDVMPERGNIFIEHEQGGKPPGAKAAT